MRRNLSLLMVLALLMALTTSCSPAKVAGKLSGKDKTPAVEVEQPTPADEGEDVVMRDLDEVDFQSYRFEWRIDTLEEGEEYSTSMLVEYSADGPAQRTVMRYDDVIQETIQIGDLTYFGAGDQWTVYDSTDSDPFDSSPPGVLGWHDRQTMYDDDECTRKGAENVEGVATIHYHCEPKEAKSGVWDFGDVVIEQAYADYYESKDLGITIKSIFFYQGQQAGQPASFRLETLITDINKPVTITAPEGVAAPGVPDDIAIHPDAVDKVSFGTMVSFTVNQSVADVATWYEGQMASNGWKLDADASMTIEDTAVQTWHKGDRSAQIFIETHGESASVVISVEGE